MKHNKKDAGKMEPQSISKADYDRAMKSLHIPFIEALAERVMQSEGDTQRYWKLRNRVYDIQHLPERISQLQQEVNQL